MKNFQAKNKTTGEIREFRKHLITDKDFIDVMTTETFLSEWEVIDEPKEDYSHTHCWNNKNNPCGIPLEKHTQCCLCDMNTPSSSLEDKIVEEFNSDNNNCVLGQYLNSYEQAKTPFGISEKENKKADKKINNWLKSQLTLYRQEIRKEVLEEVINQLNYQETKGQCLTTIKIMIKKL